MDYIKLFNSYLPSVSNITSFVQSLWHQNPTQAIASKRIHLATTALISERPPTHSLCSAKTITIIEARNVIEEDSTAQETQLFLSYSILDIATKELEGEKAERSASSFLDDAYFGRNSRGVESIILAKTDKEILGFIIVQKVPYSSDTSYVIYLAVDSTKKRSKVGTTLLLSAMYKTKNLGKRYLTLQYVASGIDKDREQAKIGFYNSFATKFGIPTEETERAYDQGRLYIDLRYDLEEIDFSKIFENLPYFSVDATAIHFSPNTNSLTWLKSVFF